MAKKAIIFFGIFLLMFSFIFYPLKSHSAVVSSAQETKDTLKKPVNLRVLSADSAGNDNASPDTYFVDNALGADENPGTESKPWKTLSAVKSYGEKKGFSAGDQVHLKRGETWNQRLYAYGQGDLDKNVIYSAYGEGKNPIIKKGIYHRKFMHNGNFGKNEYITFQNLNISEAPVGIDARTINHITVRNVNISSCGTGIIFSSEEVALQDWLLEDITISNSDGHGIFCYTDVNYMTVRRLVTSHNKKDGAAFRTGINNVVEDSISHHNGEDGFDVGGTVGAFSFIRCVSRENKSAGFSIKAKGNGHAIGNIFYCLSYRNHQGLEVGNNSKSNTYNSVFYNNDLFGIHLANSNRHTIKNCIISKNAEKDPNQGFQVSYLLPGQELEASSNFYGSQSKGRDIYVNKEKRFLKFSDWQNYSFKKYDAHSITGDPKFTDPSNGDFTLHKTSRCINSGLNLGQEFKYGINPTSLWVNSVLILDQNEFGKGWEIGAFIYLESE